MPDERQQPDIDLSLEDLDDVAAEAAPPAAMPSTASGGMLVIDSHDLLDVDEAPAYPAPAGEAYPAAASGAYTALPKSKKGALAGGLVGSLLIQMAIAGALGGLLAWALNECVSYYGDTHGSPDNIRTYAGICLAIATIGAAALGAGLGFSQWSAGSPSGYLGPVVGLVIGAVLGAAAAGIGYGRSVGYVPSDTASIAHTTVFSAIIGGTIALFLGIVDGIYSGNTRKLLIGGTVGLAVGAAVGGLGGLFAQIVYGILSPGGQELGLRQIIARTIGWSILGVAAGLAYSVPSLSLRKVVNGLAGGAIGGFAGGFMFDPLGMVLGGLGSRLLAIVLIGGLSGAAIGLIEELRKQAWLAVVGGPLAGKQFIIYNQVTTIGSSPKCDIALLKDPYVAAQHCVIEVAGAAYQLRDLGAGTQVNGRPIQRHVLRAGDVIQIGGTALEYQDRAVGR